MSLKEDYVSFETAKLLKEKGFDYYPDGSCWLIDANNVMYWVSEIGAYDYVDNPTESFQRPKNGYRLVTQTMAMKWLREVHNCHICVQALITTDGLQGYCPFCTKIGGVFMWENVLGDDYSTSPTYEQACESAIKYCLENLI